MAFTTQNNQMVSQQKIRAQLQALRDHVEKNAHRALRVREKQQQVNSSLTQLEQKNPTLMEVDMQKRVGNYIMVFVLGCIYCVDYILFHALVSDLTRRFLSSSQWVINLACFLVPAAIIGIELYIATLRSFAYEEKVQFNLSGRYWFWTAIGIIMSIVMTSLVVSTFLASQPFSMTQRLETILNWKLIGLAALAFVSHAAVIFGGSYALEAKTFFIFKLHHFLRSYQVRQLGRRFEKESLRTSANMSRYILLLNQYNDTYTPRINGGPFDSKTTTFVNEIFPYPVIQAQNEVQTSNNNRSLDQIQNVSPSEAVPENLNPDNGDGNIPPGFYDSIARQVKDGDSEVRI